MKINKKGMSLIELIVSLSLVSVVVILMYNLVFKINDIQGNSGFAINNQANRLEIIKTVENDLIAHNPISVSRVGNEIIFEYENGFNSSLKFYHENDLDYVMYIPYDGENYKTKWIIKNASVDYERINICSKGKMFKLTVEIDTPEEFNNKLYNNAIDDIEISYVFENELNIDICK